MKYYHSHVIIPEKCSGRMKCIKACPTKAIRLRHAKITYFDDLCVDCGACINVCPEKVFIPVIDEINDFEKFEFKIAIPSRTLYTQFGLNIHPIQVHHALKKIGFDAVVDTSKVSHEMSFVISEHLKTNPEVKPIISSFCPSLIRLIQVNYPNLMGLISTFDVPREITAKESKKKYATEKGISINKIGAIFISPCPAMVVSIKQPAEKEKSWIDGAIAIKDIYNIILPEIIKTQGNQESGETDEYFFYGKGWGEIDYVPKYMDSERCLSITGIDNIMMLLNDIEDSKLRNVDYIEAFTCTQGCIGGSFCFENPYISRHHSIMLEKRYSEPIAFDETEILEKYKEKYYFLGHQVLPRLTRSLSIDIATSIKRMKQKEKIYLKLPKKDCGLCGAPTCETFAQDCAQGEADLTDCIFFKPGSH
ncbi:MAG: [Fe-Fe] hydrogenase large subunit C-terminal domain-containing protein [Bacteroidales bacterium]|jgi:iron only hydrogenase large subunit-like protein